MKKILQSVAPWAALGIATGILSDFLHGQYSFTRCFLFMICVGVMGGAIEHWIKRVIQDAAPKN
jgi:hypothetical protein